MKQIICAETGEVVCQKYDGASVPSIWRGRVRSFANMAPNAFVTIYAPTLLLKGMSRKTRKETPK
jgi:hypothetical protein